MHKPMFCLTKFSRLFLLGAVFAASTTWLPGQKAGMADPFDAIGPMVSLGYTYLEGDFEGTRSTDFGGDDSDVLQLQQHVAGARVTQQFFGRVQLHADAGIIQNRLDGRRFEHGGAYGGGVQVLLLPDPSLYLKWAASFLAHDKVSLRGDDAIEMRIRDDWQTGFLLGREGGPQPLLGEEVSGSRTYVGVMYSGREFRLRYDGGDTFEQKDYAGFRGLVGIQLDVGNQAGLAVEGQLGASSGVSGWIYYRF